MKLERERLDLKRPEFAKKVSCSPSLVAKIETGNRVLGWSSRKRVTRSSRTPTGASCGSGRSLFVTPSRHGSAGTPNLSGSLLRSACSTPSSFLGSFRRRSTRGQSCAPLARRTWTTW
ncbi:hypothetical protein [Streptomyces sp. ISL-100]|uniref:hypothetical protein n=1 Tax=Streptomyces sp. ISL-100 TaxID=2819173 RepID=UPI0035ABE341